MAPQLTPVVLTPEERNLLYLAVTGHSPAQAAQAMDLTLPRAQKVMTSLQRRLGLSSRSALIARAIVRGWV